MNRRRKVLKALAIAVSLPGVALAQTRRVPKIGFLLLTPAVEPPSPERRAFLDGMQALGHTPGKNLEIIYRSAEGETVFMDEVAREIVAAGVDVIVSAGALPILSARRATRTIPIVMLAVGDPVGIGAVQSIARPGVNVTGVSFISSDLAPKRVQLVKELLPRARKVAVLWDAENANAGEEAAATQEAIRTLGMTPQPEPVARDADIRGVLAGLASRRPDVLYVAFEGRLVASNRFVLSNFALKQRVPLVAGWSRIPEAGGLLSYAPDIPAMFGRAASYVHRILSGERPETMPIELPTRVELVVNRRTAKALGIALPQSLLLRADRVID